MRIRDISVILLITFILMLAVAEIYLRFFARPVFSESRMPAPVCRPDPHLGWANAPGNYSAPASSLEDARFTVTINGDGSRATAPPGVGPSKDRDKIILVGGSFMFGEGLSDEQTMAWKLGQLLPDKQVLNYGVKAYGTYQSLLMLENVLPGMQDTDLVIYGFMVHHIDRNVAPAYWRAMLNIHSSRMVRIPYVSLDSENRLIRHSPAPFTPWFAGRYLLTIRILEAWLETRSFMAGNSTEKHTVMQLLLLEMRNLCKTHGCKLIVAMLNAPKNVEDVYAAFCHINGIPVIHFDLDAIRDKPLQNPEDGHPNETVNTLWADQTAAFLAGQIIDGGNVPSESSAH
ncbi:MAG: hypothetical protein ACOZBW_02195 [Thermodesulfobacteriota bacterium]